MRGVPVRNNTVGEVGEVRGNKGFGAKVIEN